MTDEGSVEDLLNDHQPEEDHRLYVPHREGWTAQLKQGGGRERCFAKHPGQDFFHLLVGGEIFVQKGAEKYCLTCAIRRGIISRNRMGWQQLPSQPGIEPL